jgi:hypothetical protein
MLRRKIALLLAFLIMQICIGETVFGQDKMTPGFIFNTENLLFNIDSYQGGIGVMLKDFIYSKDMRMNLRILSNVTINNFFNDFGVKVGAAAEFPIINDKRVIPYWGLFGDIEMKYTYQQFSPTVSTKEILFPVSAGALLGIEFFIFDSLSLFAEYNASVRILNSYAEQNGAAGTYTLDLQARTEIGNTGMIGIIIYFNPVVKIDSK